MTSAPWTVTMITGWAALLLAEKWLKSQSHWIGLRENLQETMVFTIKYGAFL